jgi:alpha-D-xyloside xylohydrolase
MNQRLLLLNILCFSFINVLLAEHPDYIPTKDGVIAFTDPVFTGTSKAVKLEVASDNIIRVIAAPGRETVAAQSLVTVYAKKLDLSLNVVSSKETPTLKTKKLTAIVDLKTGTVTFRDNSGKKTLIEKPTGGLCLQSAIFDGRGHYHFTQTFQTTEDDAWYGPGQHQDVSFNLYEDEGTNYNYEKGSSAVIPIKYTEATKQLLLMIAKDRSMGCC